MAITCMPVLIKTVPYIGYFLTLTRSRSLVYLDLDLDNINCIGPRPRLYRTGPIRTKSQF